MARSKIIGGLRHLLKRPAQASRLLIRSPGEMQEILDRERARAARGRTMFSLITFQAGRGNDKLDTLTPIASWLLQRLRSLDDVGWLDADTIGAVLPDTPGTAASMLVDEALQALGADAGLLECRTYAFPVEMCDGDDEKVALAPEGLSDVEPRTPATSPLPPADAPIQFNAADALFARPLPPLKRAVDVVGAVCGLVVLLPMLVVVAICVKCTSKGPFLFAQLRTGLGGKPFWLYKFRTMVDDAETLQDKLRSKSDQDGPAFKLRDDPRTTPLGRVLRKTSIDELPQLWNVLMGDMSLVGPRPLPCAENEACQPWHRQRLDVTPGLTCTWQVFGRSRVSFEEWMRMDIRYVRERSTISDLKLVAETVPAVISGRGAS